MNAIYQIMVFTLLASFNPVWGSNEHKRVEIDGGQESVEIELSPIDVPDPSNSSESLYCSTGEDGSELKDLGSAKGWKEKLSSCFVSPEKSEIKFARIKIIFRSLTLLTSTSIAWIATAGPGSVGAGILAAVAGAAYLAVLYNKEKYYETYRRLFVSDLNEVNSVSSGILKFGLYLLKNSFVQHVFTLLYAATLASRDLTSLPEHLELAYISISSILARLPVSVTLSKFRDKELLSREEVSSVRFGLHLYLSAIEFSRIFGPPLSMAGHLIQPIIPLAALFYCIFEKIIPKKSIVKLLDRAHQARTSLANSKIVRNCRKAVVGMMNRVKRWFFRRPKGCVEEIEDLGARK